MPKPAQAGIGLPENRRTGKESGMISAYMSRPDRSGRIWAGALALLLVLAGCDETLNPGNGTTETDPETGVTTRTTDKDIESPEVFYACLLYTSPSPRDS